MKQRFNTKAFSTAIKQKRIIEMDSLREVASNIGISYSSISRCENGGVPNVLHYAKICKWLGVEMETFFKKPSLFQNEMANKIKYGKQPLTGSAGYSRNKN